MDAVLRTQPAVSPVADNLDLLAQQLVARLAAFPHGDEDTTFWTPLTFAQLHEFGTRTINHDSVLSRVKSLPLGNFHQLAVVRMPKFKVQFSTRNRAF